LAELPQELVDRAEARARFANEGASEHEADAVIEKSEQRVSSGDVEEQAGNMTGWENIKVAGSEEV
jgi:hypothetical protein